MLLNACRECVFFTNLDYVSGLAPCPSCLDDCPLLLLRAREFLLFRRCSVEILVEVEGSVEAGGRS